MTTVLLDIVRKSSIRAYTAGCRRLWWRCRTRWPWRRCLGRRFAFLFCFSFLFVFVDDGGGGGGGYKDLLKFGSMESKVLTLCLVVMD